MNYSSPRSQSETKMIHDDVINGKSSVLHPHVENIPTHVTPLYNGGLDHDEAVKYNMRWAQRVSDNDTIYGGEFDTDESEFPFSLCLIGDVDDCRFLYCVNPAHGHRVRPARDDNDLMFGVACEARKMVELDMYCDSEVIFDSLAQWGVPVFDQTADNIMSIVAADTFVGSQGEFEQTLSNMGTPVMDTMF